jgi:NAD(P)-dependent dehydrogenase (short-subunit alcohol dehydrogenase family)
LPISAHVAKKEDINELVSKTVAIFGRIDILVNGAATSPFFGEVTDMEEWAWDAIMNLTLKGMFMLCQAVTKIMIKNGGGCILNIASSYGLKPFPGTAAYSISKAGTIMLTQALAVELGKYNIRVNAIAPGVTKTRFSQPLMQDPKLLNSIIEHTALHRIAEPEDIVGTAILLVSTASQHITGQTICIDGGSISL